MNYIPFINGATDIDILNDFHSDASIVRVTLAIRDIDSICAKLSADYNLWLDPGTDIFHDWPPHDSRLKSLYNKFDKKSLLSDVSFQKKPDKEYLRSFIKELLNRCLELRPQWLSIPQLPTIQGSGRNKINRELAKLTADWKLNSHYGGQLILPVVLTSHNLSDMGKDRSDICKSILKCYSLANADGVWIANCKLDDHMGSNILGRTRFPKYIEMHEIIKTKIPKNAIIIGGPYWGLNLILWARGIITYPAIGLGKGYRYFIPGNALKRAKKRIVLNPLIRRVVIDNELKTWLKNSSKHLPSNDKAARQLKEIYDNLKNYQYDENGSKRQIAKFYKSWILSLINTPKTGRPLALYQDFSNAFMIGKLINASLPHSEKVGRKPEKVAEQFMLNCL